MAGSAEAREEKKATMERLYELFGTHKQILLANFTNVGSNQIQHIRKLLRGYNSHLVISKNTLVKKVIRMRTEGITDNEFEHLKEEGALIPELAVLIPMLKDKIALIFSDAPIFELKSKIEANKVQTEAKVNAVSPVDFTCPAGPTGLDPSQINFFHALNISTKIVKGQIEITKDFKCCTEGKKVKASEAALLKKLNFKPFLYGMKILDVYDDGAILPKEVVNMNPDDLLNKFQDGARNIAALSLSAGYPIEATIPIIIGSAFKNIAALSIESGFKVPEIDAAASSAAVAAPVAQEKKEEKKVEAAKVEEPAEEEEDMDMGDLFG